MLRVPRIRLDRWLAVISEGDVVPKPMVLAGAFADTDVVRNWTLEVIAARFGGTRVTMWSGPPASAGQPETMTVADFARHLPAAWLTRAPLVTFPGLAGGLRMSPAAAPMSRPGNLWIGNSARSGFHFELADSLLVQVNGVDTAKLARPGPFSRPYPRPGMRLRSRTIRDDDTADRQAVLRFAGLDLFTATLWPGDALFIPRRWWHDLVSDGVSVSANTWFDLPGSSGRHGAARRGVPAACWQTIRDLAASDLRPASARPGAGEGEPPAVTTARDRHSVTAEHCR